MKDIKDPKVWEEIREKVLKQLGIVVVSHAKDWCPVDTGRLRSSIDYIVIGDEVHIGTNVEYGPDVEYFGGSGKKKSLDPKHPLTTWAALRARGGAHQSMPFLRPAVFRAKEDIREIFKKALE